MDTWPRPYDVDAPYAAIATRQFRYATWDWCTTWKTDQPAGPAQPYDFSCFDAMVPFVLKANLTVRTDGIVVNAHALTKTGGADLPDWVLAAVKPGSKHTRADLRGFFAQRIAAVVPHWLKTGARFAGLIAVNEAFWNQKMDGTWPQNWVFGPEANVFSWAYNGTTDWFGDAFRRTRAAADAAGHPDLRLFYNDYAIETATPKADAVLRFITEQKAAGVPIGGVGFQSHMRCDCKYQPGCNNATAITANLARFASLGLSIWITELDVAMAPSCTLKMQAEVYTAVISACLALGPAVCDAAMVWGFSDRYTWLNNVTQAPTITDAEFRPKPAFFALQALLSSDAE